jgi:hypothetical protein
MGKPRSGDRKPIEAAGGRRASEDTAWASQVLSTRALVLLSPFTRYRSRPWATVYQAMTSGGPVWLKVNGAELGYESKLVSYLAAIAPDHLPVLFATDEVHGRILMRHAGIPLSEIPTRDPLDRWCQAMHYYGLIQRRVERNEEMLRASGVPDVRPLVIPSLLTSLIRDKRLGMASSFDDQVLRFLPQLTDWCAELTESGIPITIQHDDLHKSNILVDRNKIRFIDWADASISFPFISILYPLANMLSEVAPSERLTARIALLESYLEPWSDLGQPRELTSLLEISARIAAFGRALAYRRALSGIDVESVDAYYTSGQQRWLMRLISQTSTSAQPT